jgi:nucleotide-binding universal stress UspA family protein
MVKLGDPATKIVEMAEKKLKVDMIVMGATGLSNSEEIGHVSRTS